MYRARILRLAVLLGFFCVIMLIASCGEPARIRTEKPEVVYVEERPEKPKKEPEPEITYSLTISPIRMDSNGLMREMIKSYNKLHPDRGVKQLVTGTTEEEKANTLDKVSAEIAAGEGPDILILRKEELKDFYEKGRLATIDEIAPYLKNEIVPAVVEQGMTGDSFVGLGYSIDWLNICLVNEKLFSGREWTIGEVLDIMDSHPELKRTFISNWGTGEYTDQIALFDVYNLDGEDSPYIDYSAGKCNFYCDEFVRLLERIYADKQSGFNKDNIENDYFLSYFMEEWDVKSLIDELTDKKDNYRLIGCPGVKNGAGLVMVYSFIAVNKNSTHKEEIAEFLDYVLSADAQCQSNYMMGIPVRSDIAEQCLQMDDEFGLIWKLGDKDGTGSFLQLADYDGDVNELVTLYEELLNQSVPAQSNSEVYSILFEEIIGGYLKSENPEDPNEVAKRIQKRVQEYLDSLP